MSIPEIRKDEDSFIETLKSLKSDIDEVVFDMLEGKDYDEEKAEKLFRIHKFLKD